ncbi:hypothetical protein BH11BAC4_BH11BAC4_18140 [soil metagenome]
MKTVLIEIYSRDLLKLREELNSYKEERSIWAIAGNISNSAGNLCLHLVGNLNHFIGAVLGNTGYVRKREDEFTSKNIPRSELIFMIEKTRDMLLNILTVLNDADLENDFPVKYNDQTVRTDFMLMHLLAHLNYHLGQMNYHRRLTEK